MSTHERLNALERARPAPIASVELIIAWGLRAPENIGAVIRLAANFGCGKVAFVDEAGTKHNLRRIEKTSVDASSHVDWRFLSASQLEELRSPELAIVGLETTEASVDLRDVVWPARCALMVGGERLGLPAQAVELCSQTVHIPTSGSIRSLNVSHALAIALFGAALGATAPHSTS